MKTILIIDDDLVLNSLLRNMLTKSGYEVITTTNGEDGLRLTKLKDPDLVITDFEMPGLSGLEVVKDLAKNYPGLPVIMLTCHSDVSLTIKAIQAGAYDYIEKPIQPQKMLTAIRNGLQVSEQNRQIDQKTSFPVRKILEDNILAGKTPRIREIVKNIGRISMTRMSVLILGENGSGKAQVANLIHYSGITSDHPLIVINCEVTTAEIIEHELIGYTKGAFENAKRDKTGKLVLAGEGTIVLNEFHLLPLTVQQKLFRIFDDQMVYVAGSDEVIPFKARIIATSSTNMDRLLEEGSVLPELYYQLKMFYIDMPPLRNRPEDIPELINHFLDKHCRRLSKSVTKIEAGTLELLQKHNWPGNIRELENAVTQAIILSRGDILEKEHIKQYLNKQAIIPAEHQNITLEEMEKYHILKVLKDVQWNKLAAVRILNISRPTLYSKMEKYQIKGP